MFKRRTGVVPAAIPILAALGVVLIVMTVPAVFLEPHEWADVPVLRELWQMLGEAAQWFTGLYNQPGFKSSLTIAANVTLWAVLAMPVAAILRATREESLEPLASTMLALGLGILSLPAILWGWQLVQLVIDVVFNVFSWLDQVGQWFREWIGSLGWWVAFILLAILLVAVVYGVVVNAGVRRWALRLGIVAAVMYVLFVLLDIHEAELFQTLGEWLAAGWSAFVAGVAWVAIFLLKIVIWILIVSLAIALLAQFGANFWLPLTAAFGAGGRQSRTVDLAAGSGVALSIVLTAATVNIDFRTWLGVVLSESVLGPYLTWIHTTFGSLIPADSTLVLIDLFESFSGFPEFFFVAIACVVGNVSLTFGARKRSIDGIGHIITFATARTIMAVLLVLPALIAIKVLSDE
jgi:hypothetical protein